MIGVLLLTHSFLGNAFIQAIEQIMGPQQNLKAIDVNGQFDHEVKWKAFMEAIQSLDKGKGVIVLTDLFGSSPSNLALAALGTCMIEVVVGVNLPMLLTVIEYRHRTTLEDLAERAKNAGKQDIKVASSLLTMVHEDTVTV
jgi:PTS system mannose-specific IIA component